MSITYYRPEIDGLRALAVGAVIAFHAGVGGPSYLPLSGGQLGVDIFFVISGFLTTRLLVESKGSFGRTIVDFYLRRARRILPAALCMFLVASFAGCLFLLPSDLIGLGRSVAASLFFVSNIYFLGTTGYFAEPAATTPLLHTWSLSVEEQFYLLLPLLLGVLRPRLSWIMGATLILALLSVALAVGLSVRHSDAVFYLLPTRAWELLAGTFVAILPLKWRFAPVLTALGFFLILGALCYGGVARGVGFGNGVVVFGTMAVIWFGGRGDPVSRVLSNPVPVGIGLISYSLYLWHQPLLAFARLTSWGALGSAQIAAVVALTVGVSTFSYFVVELPFRSKTLAWPVFSTASLGAAAVLVVFAGVVEFDKGLPFRFSGEVQRLLASNVERGVASRGGRTCSERGVEESCVLGDPTVLPTIALVGDSHAEALSGTLDEALTKRGLSALMLTKPSCPFIDGVEAMDGSVVCGPFISNAEHSIITRGVKTVIIQDRAIGYISGSRFDNGEGGVEPGAPFPVAPVGFSGTELQRISADVEALARTILGLRQTGVEVYLILPIPEAGWNVPRAVAHAAATGHLPLTLSLRYLERSKPIFDLLPVLERAGVIPVRPSDVLCDATTRRCRTHDDATIYYNDTDHLSRSGARVVVGAIMSAIDRQTAKAAQTK